MRGAYRVVALVVAALVVVQAAAVSLSAFGFRWDATLVGVAVVPPAALLLVLAAVFARVPGGVVAAVLVLLAAAVQAVLAVVAFDTPEVGAVHSLTAFVLFGLATLAAERARRAPGGGRSVRAGQSFPRRIARIRSSSM